MAFPKLFPQPSPGMSWPVIRDPKLSQRRQRVASGRTLHSIDQLYPIYQWTLTYEILRDPYDRRAIQSTTNFPNEFRRLFAFYAQTFGSGLPFLFYDPTDGYYVGGPSGVTDGTSTIYQLYRALYTDGIFEPIHAAAFGINAGMATFFGVTEAELAFKVYLDGVLVNPSAYDPLSHRDVEGYVYGINFHSAPAAGKFISLDMFYAWPCHFSEDNMPFEYFLANRWKVPQLKFESFLMSSTFEGV